MNKTLKYILIGVAILAAALIFIFNDELLNKLNLGAVVASIAGGLALIKSKFTSDSTLTQDIASVETEHVEKRQEWALMKEEFDSKYNALKARMDFLDYQAAKINAQIKDLDDAEIKAIQKIDTLTIEEKLEKLKNL